jgi:uncharacterized protein
MVIVEELAVEIKSTSSVQPKHIKGLRALREEKQIKNFCVMANESRTKIIDGITVYPWKVFLDKLWSGQLDLV